MENSEYSRLIYIVEDNEMYAGIVKIGLEGNLNKPGNPKSEIKVFYTGEDMLAQLQEGKESPDIVVLDFFLNSSVPEAKNGDIILTEFRKFFKNKGIAIPAVVMLTASKDINSAVSLLKKGAKDFIIKDDSFLSNLTKSINTIFEFSKLKSESKKHEAKAEKYKKGLIISLSIVGVVVAVLFYILFAILLK